jgi:hypothetical protein
VAVSVVTVLMGGAVIALLSACGAGSLGSHHPTSQRKDGAMQNVAFGSGSIGRTQAETFLSLFASDVQCGRGGSSQVSCTANYSGSHLRVRLGRSSRRHFSLIRCVISRMGSKPSSKYACQNLSSEVGLSQAGPGTTVPKGMTRAVHSSLDHERPTRWFAQSCRVVTSEPPCIWARTRPRASQVIGRV